MDSIPLPRKMWDFTVETRRSFFISHSQNDIISAHWKGNHRLHCELKTKQKHRVCMVGLPIFEMPTVSCLFRHIGFFIPTFRHLKNLNSCRW